MPLSAPPAFKPAVAPIALGAAGTVLTSNGTTAATPPTFQAAGGGGGTLTGRVAYASPAGANNNVNPGGGWPAALSRLVVSLAGGNANWTGLLAGTDGQLLFLTNADEVNSLTLNADNAGSLAANQFSYAVDLVLGPGVSKLLCYDSTLAQWLLT